MNKENILCPTCKEDEFYILSDGRYKCKQCSHRFSPKKHLHVKQILHNFSQGLSPKQSAHLLSLSKPTTLKYFSLFRQLLILHSQNLYHEKSFDVQEYEEYRYKNISIIGMVVDKNIYTLLLPPQEKNPNRLQKISRIKKFDTPLQGFWSYLEQFMKRFYGIKTQYFPEYLKEAEFRYNTSEDKRLKTLNNLWQTYSKNL